MREGAARPVAARARLRPAFLSGFRMNALYDAILTL
jgi:hypothetical protein